MKIDFEKLFGSKKWAMYCIALMIGLAMGVINPLATTHMTRNNTGNMWIGAISSSYFLLMALGSIFVYKKQRGKDIRKILIAGLLLTAACSVAFPLVSSRYLWFLLMSLMGAGISFNMVGIQSAMHNVTESGNKALVSGIYSFCFAVGFAVSAVVGPVIYENITWLSFLIGAFGLCIAAALIYFQLKGLMTIPAYTEGKIFSRINMALLGAFAYGFSETTLVSLFPLYMLRQNFGLSKIGYALGIFIVGSLIGTIPITYLADKIGRKKCLGITIFASLFAIAGIMAFDGFSSKLIFSFIGGFTIGPVYPLSLALSVQDLTKEELLSGTALFTFSYGIGSTAGPFLSSVTMEYFGNNYIFSVCFIIFIVLLLRMIISGLNSKGLATKEEL